MITVDRSNPRNYEEDGRRYFGVTTICHAMTGRPPYGDQAAMDRGTDLHAIFALAVASYAGRCTTPVVPTCYAGYYQSIQRWIDWMKPEPVRIESPSISSVKGLPFAGTPDLLARVQYGGTRTLALLDMKTGQMEPWHAVQVMAYGKLREYLDAEVMGLLYLSADGELPTFCRVKQSQRGWAAFQSALNLLIWRESL